MFVLQQLISGVAAGSLYALLAVSFVLIYKVTKVANFALGAMMVTSSFLAFSLLVTHKFSYPMTFVLTLLLSALMGIVLERFVSRPLVQKSELSMVTGLLALWMGLKSLDGLIWGNNYLVMPPLFRKEPYRVLGLVVAPANLWIVVTACALMLGFFFFFRSTRVWIALRAVSQNRLASVLVGVSVTAAFSLTWVIAGVVGAASGILMAPLLGLDPEMDFVGLKAVVAAVVGGFESLPGAVVCGLALGVLENVVGIFAPTEVKDSIAFFLAVSVLMLKPGGIFGEARAKKV